MLVAAVTFAALGAGLGVAGSSGGGGGGGGRCDVGHDPRHERRGSGANGSGGGLRPGDPFAGLTRGQWDARPVAMAWSACPSGHQPGRRYNR